MGKAQGCRWDGEPTTRGKGQIPTYNSPEPFPFNLSSLQPIAGVGGREMHHPGTSVSVGRDQHLALGGTSAAGCGM